MSKIYNFFCKHTSVSRKYWIQNEWECFIAWSEFASQCSAAPLSILVAAEKGAAGRPGVVLWYAATSHNLFKYKGVEDTVSWKGSKGRAVPSWGRGRGNKREGGNASRAGCLRSVVNCRSFEIKIKYKNVYNRTRAVHHHTRRERKFT